MHNILLEILRKKRNYLKEQKKKVTLEELKKDLYKKNVAKFLFKERILSSPGIALIAEIKLASPTIKSLGSEEEIISRAIEYEKSGASAISFITEKYYFKGEISFIPQLKRKIHVPVLQKDFVVDEYQIYEGKKVGADALLIIVRYLNTELLQNFISLCFKLDIEPIVEINNNEDLEKAISTTTNFIAVNARNLEDFRIDVDNACELLKKIPEKFLKLGFSGILSSEEVRKYKNAGAKGVLVGTKLMKEKNIKEFLKSLKI